MGVLAGVSLAVVLVAAAVAALCVAVVEREVRRLDVALQRLAGVVAGSSATEGNR